MRDITEEIEVKLLPRAPGKIVDDELWHEGRHVGYLTAMGPRFTDKAYFFKLMSPGNGHIPTSCIFVKEKGDK